MNVFFYSYIMIQRSVILYAMCGGKFHLFRVSRFRFALYTREGIYIYFIREERQKHQKQIDSQRWYAREVCDR